MKKFSKIKSLFLISFVLPVFYAPCVSWAEEKQTAQAEDQIEKHEEISEQDLSQLESLGLYANSAQGSLGKDLWADSNRSSVTHLLQSLRNNANNPSVNRLTLSALLTKADASRIINDVKPELGQDLLTLRLEKLIEFGAYKQAYQITSNEEKAPYHERLARAEIMATLLNGEKSNACLENKVEDYPNEKFWQILSAYCNSTLSESPDPKELEILKNADEKLLYALATQKDFIFKYTPKTFSELSLLERAYIAAENKIDASLAESIKIQDIPSTDLQILLRQTSLNFETRMGLTARALELGLIEPESLTKLYADSLRKLNAASVDGQDLTLPSNDWDKPAYYLNLLKNADDQQKSLIVADVLALGPKLGIATLWPFATAMQNIKPVDLDLNTLRIAFDLFNLTGTDITPAWSDSVENAQGVDKNSEIYRALTGVASIARSSQSAFEAIEIPSQFNKNLSRLDELLIIFMKKIDNSNNSGNYYSVYEKIFNLTPELNYVMPSSVVWDRLTKVSNSKALGETILLSTVLMQGSSLHEIYPGVLRDILRSTEDMGLTRLSKTLAIRAILDSIKK